MDLKEIGISTRNWDDSVKDRDHWRAFVNATFNLRVPLAMELAIGDEYLNLQRKAKA